MNELSLKKKIIIDYTANKREIKINDFNDWYKESFLVENERSYI